MSDTSGSELQASDTIPNSNSDGAEIAGRQKLSKTKRVYINEQYIIDFRIKKARHHGERMKDNREFYNQLNQPAGLYFQKDHAEQDYSVSYSLQSSLDSSLSDPEISTLDIL